MNPYAAPQVESSPQKTPVERLTNEAIGWMFALPLFMAILLAVYLIRGPHPNEPEFVMSMKSNVIALVLVIAATTVQALFGVFYFLAVRNVTNTERSGDP